jgi:hypothetical protein
MAPAGLQPIVRSQARRNKLRLVIWKALLLLTKRDDNSRSCDTYNDSNHIT